MGSGSIKRDVVLVGTLLQRDLDAVVLMGFKRKPARIDLGAPEWTFSDDELDQSLFLRVNLQLSYRILNAKHFLPLLCASNQIRVAPLIDYFFHKLDRSIWPYPP